MTKAHRRVSRQHPNHTLFLGFQAANLTSGTFGVSAVDHSQNTTDVHSPGRVGNWLEPLGIVALCSEATVIGFSLAALRRTRLGAHTPTEQAHPPL
jgi:hypothetical protein